ncbi:hypothetical protein FB451DRAFT_679017 [Mycena latifolia]|nr:hypothetical protein FB451DRAFT_679017 [Mycena latifolia]
MTLPTLNLFLLWTVPTDCDASPFQHGSTYTSNVSCSELQDQFARRWDDLEKTGKGGRNPGAPQAQSSAFLVAHLPPGFSYPSWSRARRNLTRVVC